MYLFIIILIILIGAISYFIYNDYQYKQKLDKINEIALRLTKIKYSTFDNHLRFSKKF